MAMGILPNELLRVIFSNLYQPDLYALSLCSHHLHSIAEPFLHADFVQKGNSEIPLFLRTVARKPHLSKHVRTMSVSFRRRLHPPPRFRLSDLATQDRAILRRCMPDNIFGSRNCDEWAQDLFEFEVWDAAVALLLVLFSSSLQTVTLKWFKYLSEHTFSAAVLSHASNRLSLQPQPLLSNLNTVFFGGPREPALTCHEVHQWAMIPSVKQLHAYAVDDTGRAEEVSRFSTTDVSLKSSSLDSPGMYCFLRSFTSLRHFSYGHRGGRILDPSAVNNGLQKSKHSLESLALTMENPEYLRGVRGSPPMGSLAGFSALKVLDVDIEMLVGWEGSSPVWYSPEQIEAFMSALPKSLESLVLRNCKYAVIDCINEIFLTSKIPLRLRRFKVSIITLTPGGGRGLSRPYSVFAVG